MAIHPTAIVDPQANVGESAEIGPYCIVGADVCIGARTQIKAHVYLEGPLEIGDDNIFFPYSTVGVAPQDLKYRGERSSTRIGHRNKIREFVTVHRGTEAGGMLTTLGDDNLLMAYVHVAHDVSIGNHAVLANAATIGGHVVVGDWAVISAGSAVHQFCRIGRHAIVGGYSVITQDVLPFSMTVSEREVKVFGANVTGLERRGFAPEKIERLQKALRLLTRSGLNTSQALARICEEIPPSDEIDELIAFIGASQRGVVKKMRCGMIAGSGRFPVLALESARQSGLDVVVIAIKEEASAEIERLASRCYWISLGGLSRLIEICKQESISELMMCGQVKHARIFSSIVPDWRLVKLLASLDSKNTDALIGGVQKVLAGEGITLADSTRLLKGLLAPEGVLTRRKPSPEETRDLEYGRRIATALSALDLGQSVAVAERACVALEAMEGTDAMLRRAASLVEGKPLRLVKASGRRHHLLFDVPVIGPGTINVMRETGTTALAVDAGRTLLLDREELLDRANRAGVTIAAYPC